MENTVNHDDFWQLPYPYRLRGLPAMSNRAAWDYLLSLLGDGKTEENVVRHAWRMLKEIARARERHDNVRLSFDRLLEKK